MYHGFAWMIKPWHAMMLCSKKSTHGSCPTLALCWFFRPESCQKPTSLERRWLNHLLTRMIDYTESRKEETAQLGCLRVSWCRRGTLLILILRCQRLSPPTCKPYLHQECRILAEYPLHQNRILQRSQKRRKSSVTKPASGSRMSSTLREGERKRDV